MNQNDVKVGRREPGFTLVEMLVALSMMGILFGIAYATYAATTRSVARCGAKIAVAQEARAVLARMAREIRCVYVGARARPKKAGGTRDLLEDGPRSLVGHDGSGQGDLLQLLTTGAITRPDELDAGVREVAYRLDESNRTLLRRQTKSVDLSEARSDDRGWWVVARNVRAVSVRYFDGKDWREKWDSQDEQGPPGAVRVEISFDTESGGRTTFATAARTSYRSDRADDVTVQTRSTP